MEDRALALGRAIRAARRSRDLTQGQLAELLGLSERTVQHWEAGTHVPALTWLDSLCSLLGVPADYFRQATSG